MAVGLQYHKENYKNYKKRKDKKHEEYLTCLNKGHGLCNEDFTSEYGDSDGAFLFYAGSVLLLGDFIFYIVRSYSYDKPTNDKYGSNEYGGFNLAVLPNRRGEAMPYLMYNKTF
jgi:hypothetical protein